MKRGKQLKMELVKRHPIKQKKRDTWKMNILWKNLAFTTKTMKLSSGIKTITPIDIIGKGMMTDLTMDITKVIEMA